eukprot:6461920-Amphidinium_carterae.1
MEERDEEARAEFIAILADWLLSAPGWSLLGSQLAECEHHSERLQIVADAFADRASGTIRLRSKAPASRARAFVEAAVLIAAIAQSPSYLGGTFQVISAEGFGLQSDEPQRFA